MRPLLAATLLLTGCASAPRPALRMGAEEIEVRRDSWGIPHIRAKSVEGVFWAEGYVEAQDRLWQMETFRRAAKGESAEVFGEKSVAADLERRRTGYTEAELRTMFGASSARTRSAITAYVRGVNAFIAEGKLPASFAEFKVVPRPWIETDCVAIGVMMARRFGEAGAIEMQLLAIHGVLEGTLGLDKGNQVFRSLLPGGDPRAPTTLHDHAGAGPPPPRDEKHNRAPSLDPEWYAAYSAERQAAQEALEAIGAPAYGGSNAWVIGPKKSAGGHPILYAGPMMGFNAPCLADEIHLTAPGLDAAGMSFAGLPGITIGFNGRIAWATTSGGADLVDVYSLRLHPERGDEYFWKGEWRKLDSFDVEIRIAGKPARTEKIYRSRYGPLLGTLDLKQRRAYTQATSFWMKEQDSFDALLDFNFASNLDEFRASISKISTSHNFFAADREGHIGFWYAGAHPVRAKGHDQRLPQKGDGSMDWQGTLPFAQWPQSVDPAHGFFANWNNKPSRAWGPSGFGRVFWGQRIIDAIERTPKLTFEQVAGLAQEAAHHAYLADYFTPFILSSIADSREESLVRARDYLAKWDRMKRPGEPGPALVERWVRGMARKVLGDELGMMLAQREVERIVADPLLRLLEGEKMEADLAGGADLQALSRDVLRELLKDGLDKLAWVPDTINFKGKVGRVVSEKGRGSFQMTVELRPDGPRAVTLCAPGQSESPDSPHYADQLDLFKEWKCKPFDWRPADSR